MGNKSTKNRNHTICFVAGKSGGHLIPAITLAKKNIHNKKSFKNILFFSTNSTLDKKIICEEKKTIPILHIPLALDNIPKKIFKYPLFLIHLILAFCKSFYILIRNKPDKVISMGGYISIPVCIAAYLLRIPITLFELNAVPGKAVKFLAPLATNINVCFKKAIDYLPPKKCSLSAYPIRFEKSELTQLNQLTHLISSPRCSINGSNFQRDPIAPINPINPTFFKKNKNKQTILVLGGSQGSIAINNLIKQLFIQNPNLSQSIQIIHQTGDTDNTNWSKFYKKIGITSHVFAFNSNIQPYYHLADMVICRSGAGTLFETLFFQKKCITIPLETATTGHQIDNAKEISSRFPHLVAMMRQVEGAQKLEKLLQI